MLANYAAASRRANVVKIADVANKVNEERVLPMPLQNGFVQAQ